MPSGAHRRGAFFEARPGAAAARLACVLLGICLAWVGAYGQRPDPEGNGVGPQLITVGGGPGNIEQQVAGLDFAEIMLQKQAKSSEDAARRQRENQELVASGAISALDLAAPPRAIQEYNEAIGQMRSQHPAEAITHLQKAIALYPTFVSAYNSLGLAFSDTDNNARARSEFEAAIQLDGKFPGALLNLGRLAISQQDYATAEKSLGKALSLRPTDVQTLVAMAYAQNGLGEYRQAIQTVERIHQLPHTGLGYAHYVAAAAALALQDSGTFERELKLFLQEDPMNPLAPEARLNLQRLAENREKITIQQAKLASQKVQLASAIAANDKRLKDQLNALGNGSGDPCSDCGTRAPIGGSTEPAGNVEAGVADVPLLPSGNSWTIRKVVDEVALFFAVSHHGHMVNDLTLSEIQIRDDSRPPAKVLAFIPQSKLPLRVGLLVDTSGSVQPRFGFEKHAASKFLQQLLTSPSDLAFVAGFANSPDVVQDFTGNHEALEKGIHSLTNAGGTALFDAVSFACGKLAEFPEGDRVAKVLVVLTDGEDNSSHTTLRRTISDAENSGVTIYAISTKDTGGDKTDADRILQALAERSGGEAFFPQDNESLNRSFDKLRDIIRSRYLIAYKPADFQPDGKYRSIVVTATKDGSRLQVHARKGYHARITPPDAY
jgi:VWFA-related protein